MIDISTLTIISAREGLKSGKFTSRELTQACLDVIKKKDGEIHAFLQVYDNALAQADEADKKIVRISRHNSVLSFFSARPNNEELATIRKHTRSCSL